MTSLAATTEEAVKRFSADDVLSPYVYVFYAAFLVSFLFTPIMKSVASFYGIVDKPDGARKVHREPVAYLGGVAVFLGWLAGLAISQVLTAHKTDAMTVSHVHVHFVIVAAGILIVLLGLFDDTRGLSPKVKIGGQIAAAGLLLLQGIGARSASPLLGALSERIQLFQYGATQPVGVFPEWVVLACSSILVVGLIVFCCNATNLLDGLDGLCGGVTGIISLGYVFLAVVLAMYTVGTLSPESVNKDAQRIVLALALLGGVVGFVPYNFNPASIFMGDTGSMFLGFAMALQILLMAEHQSKWLLAGLVMFALPIMDTTLAFVRRFVNKRPFFSADKHHIHHQFLARGLSVRQTVLFLYASSIGFVILGASIAFMRTRYAVAFYLVIFGSIIVAAYKMGMVHERTKSVLRNPVGPDDEVNNSPEGVLRGVIDVDVGETGSTQPQIQGSSRPQTT